MGETAGMKTRVGAGRWWWLVLETEARLAEAPAALSPSLVQPFTKECSNMKEQFN